MQFAGHAATGIICLLTGLFIGEVSLPGVGTLKKEGSTVSADIGQTAYRARGKDLMIMTPGVGFLSQSGEGKQGCLEGTILASRSADSMQFMVATKTREPRRTGGKLVSMAELVFPKIGSLTVTGNTVTGGDPELTQIEIGRVTDDLGTTSPIITLLLTPDVGGLQMINIHQDENVLVTSPKELTSRARLGDVFSYGFKENK
jgi:hypothetical protein